MQKLILSVVVAVVVTLGCLLVGGILASLGVSIVSVIGGFLTRWSAVLGILAGLWFFFSGGFSWPTLK